MDLPACVASGSCYCVSYSRATRCLATGYSVWYIQESYQYWPDGNSPTFTAGQYSVQVMNGEEVEDIETMAGVGMKALRVEHAMVSIDSLQHAQRHNDT